MPGSDACVATATAPAPSWEAERLTLGVLQMLRSSCLQLFGRCLLAVGHLQPGCQLCMCFKKAPVLLLMRIRCQDGLQYINLQPPATSCRRP